MLSSLDAAYAFVRDTPRKRSSVEAHWKLNRAYFDLIFAWGYAQSGNEARSSELLEQARAALPRFDPVHQTALNAFELRIREHGPSPWTGLDIELTSLDTLDRYKLVRLFEMLAILSRVEKLNAISQFWRERDGSAIGLVLPEDAVTQVLLADGEGRQDDVRAALHEVFSTSVLNGALLIGASRRAGREAELLAWLQGRPPGEAAVALQALGLGALARQDFELLESHPIARVLIARQHIGALTLSGRTAEAEALAVQAWSAATDSFNTNTSFCLMALAICETIVLSALRHELALGNRSRLEAVEPAGAVVAPGAGATDDAEAFFGFLGSALCDLAASPGEFQGRFRDLHERVTALTGQRADDHQPSPKGHALSDQVRDLKSLVGTMQSLFTADEGSSEKDVQTADLLREAAGLIAAFENRDPAAAVAFERFKRALCTISGCLPSLVVERPMMRRNQFDRIRACERAVDAFFIGPPSLDEQDEADHWLELPFDELIRLTTSSVEEANRELLSIPEEWDPELVACAREVSRVVTEFVHVLREL